MAEISHRGRVKQRQEGTPGKQRVPLRRRGTSVRRKCRLPVNREAVQFSPIIIPRSWHNMTFGKYARSYARKVGEPEDEPQVGLVLKRQSAKRG